MTLVTSSGGDANCNNRQSDQPITHPERMGYGIMFRLMPLLLQKLRQFPLAT
jgi:hypothetical protein